MYHTHIAVGMGKQIAIDKNVVYTNLKILSTFFEILYVSMYI